MSFITPDLPPERTAVEAKEARLAVAEKALATARAYAAEAAYHPHDSERRQLLQRYSNDYMRTAKALFEAANR